MEEKITLCGDNCIECPRYNAHSDEELRNIAELWYRVGWRDHIVSKVEIKCEGCSSAKTCTYHLVECTKVHNVDKCNQCAEFPCEKISNMLERSKEYQKRCQEVCSDAEYEMLERAFFDKENNLRKGEVERMVLLVVDTQKLITTPDLYNFSAFEAAVKTLIAAARENGVEVIYARHDDGVGAELTKGTPGFEIYEGFRPQLAEKIFDKTVNSSFKGAGLLEYLREKNVHTVVVVGLQTDYCIDATIKCGFEHGFKMTVPENANTTFDNDFMTGEQSYKYYNEFMWKGRYAEFISVEETIERMKG